MLFSAFREDGTEPANEQKVADLQRKITQALLQCLIRRVSQVSTRQGDFFYDRALARSSRS